MSSRTRATTTAGLRGAFWDPDKLPANTQFDAVVVQCEDGAACQGMLAFCGDEQVVGMSMHPREYVPNNYLVPEFLTAGFAMYTQAPRSIGNDLRLEHETALLEVASGVQYLRANGFEKVVLVGLSGGASLFSFYIQQASLPPEDRIGRTPAGKPTRLLQADLPLPDGIVFVSPHPGQGILLMHSLDPSVVDENDPMQCDEALNPFNPDNGFRMPPDSSSYSHEFVTRYRQAQRDRVARIDNRATASVASRMAARNRFKETNNSSDLRLSAYTPIITVWRTDADLRCFDLSLEPTSRAYGSLWGSNPFVSNYGSIGFGRICTADSWLSTWSGLSSNAEMLKTAASIHLPTLVVRFDGDNSVFPSETQAAVDVIPAADKTYEVLPGNHHGRPVRDEDPDGQKLAGELMTSWIRKRFM